MKQITAGLVVVLIAIGCGDDSRPTQIDESDPSTEVLAGIADSALAVAVSQALSQSSIDSLTSLSAVDRGIGDLSGIEQLSSLRNLDLTGNDITDIAPLADLDSLVLLDLSANRVADLTPLAGLSQLQIVILTANFVTDLDVLLSLPALAVIDVTGNPLDDDQRAHLSALEAADVQVSFVEETDPDETDPIVEIPEIASMQFLFNAPVSNRRNIWQGSTDGLPTRPLFDDLADFSRPIWSPDGSSIVFQSNRGDDLRQFYRIHRAAADGSALEAISDWGAGTPVAWSPDGTRLIVSRRGPNNTGGLAVFDMASATLTTLTDPDNALDHAADFSPDGSAIAFIRQSVFAQDDNGTLLLEPAYPDSNAVLRLDVASGQLTKVTQEVWIAGNLTWLPRRDELLYSTTIAGNSEVVIASPTGEVRVLASNEGIDSYPAVSPTGATIAFVSDREIDDDASRRDLYTVRINDSGLTRLTEGDANVRAPSWSPDGTLIAYLSDRGGVWSIWITDATGSFHLNLTTGSPVIEDTFDPVSWQPVP